MKSTGDRRAKQTESTENSGPLHGTEGWLYSAGQGLKRAWCGVPQGSDLGRLQRYEPLHHRDEGGGRHGSDIIVQVLQPLGDGRQHSVEQRGDEVLPKPHGRGGETAFTQVKLLK